MEDGGAAFRFATVTHIPQPPSKGSPATPVQGEGAAEERGGRKTKHLSVCLESVDASSLQSLELPDDQKEN
ncbi:hypothetical protein EYF80_016601 [Liparis tanakae]|uniref:Uncharacterized protein n=1 Tax=Liparis tanakae TaxID=230148 RepID=A0A4Z2I6N5_9TELE|nr:hypothetical protein EYF80_016601 [Liparis tanakae]